MAKIDLSENEFIEQFVGQDPIDANDHQFWHQLLSCSFNFMRVQDPKVVDKMLEPYLVRLTLNNSYSLNIGTLVKVFLVRVQKMKIQGNNNDTNSYFAYQAFNALYLLRCICKSFIETLNEEQLVKNLKAYDVSDQLSPGSSKNETNFIRQADDNINNANNVQNQVPVSTTGLQLPLNSSPVSQPPSDTTNNFQTVNAEAITSDHQNQSSEKAITSGICMLDQMVNTIISIIVDIPLNDMTYLMKLESINTLLILLSVQLYSPTPISESLIYECLMKKKCSIHALVLTKTLLANFIHQYPAPEETGSIIIGLASGIWKVLTLSFVGSGDDEENFEKMSPLGRQSLLLLNVLTNHFSPSPNPYREAIISCQDIDYNYLDPTNVNNQALFDANLQSSQYANSIKISFRDLYWAICRYFYDDQVALILYLLVHRNQVFKQFLLVTVAPDLDMLILPMLRVLYSKIEKGSHHTYMVLIILIILSEEKSFNQAVHKQILNEVPWYKDRLLTDIPLGSFLILILVRSIQYNTFRAEDRFLHTNLFAVFANMSNHVVYLNPHACQRITQLVERLTKRFSLKASNQQQLQHQQNVAVNIASSETNLSVPTTTTDCNNDQTLNYGNTTTNTNYDINNVDSFINMPPLPIRSDALDSNQTIIDRQSTNNDSPLNNKAESVASSETAHASISMDIHRDTNLIEDVIKFLLSVINNILTMKMKQNCDLIYTLLYKRKTFKQLLANSLFYNEIINIERILTYIYNKIESNDQVLTTEEIKDIIKEACDDWNYDQPDDANGNLTFKYVEDEQPEEFFVPYIWTHIYYSAGIPWNSKRILLFNPNQV